MSAPGGPLVFLYWQISFLLLTPTQPLLRRHLWFLKDEALWHLSHPVQAGASTCFAPAPAPRALPALPKGCSQLRHSSLRLAAGCCRSMRGAVGGLGFFQPLHLQVSLAWRQKDQSKSLCVSQGRGASPQPELCFHCHPSPRCPKPRPLAQAPPPPCKPRRPLASQASWRAAVPGLAPSSGWRAAAGSGQVEPDPPRSRYPHFLPRAPPSQRSRLGLQLERGQVPEWEPESAPKPGWE